MPPYGRDAGLSQPEAERLADLVKENRTGHVAVEREGRYYVLVVETPRGRWTLRDDADVEWLQRLHAPRAEDPD